MDYELIIIGSGPGGYRAAEYAARQGMQVLVIEADKAVPVSTADVFPPKLYAMTQNSPRWVLRKTSEKL